MGSAREKSTGDASRMRYCYVRVMLQVITSHRYVKVLFYDFIFLTLSHYSRLYCLGETLYVFMVSWVFVGVIRCSTARTKYTHTRTHTHTHIPS